jgi:acyl-CoA thioester hydrolase
MAFEREFQVAWEHLDANAHAANTAYMQLAVNARFLYLASKGFTPAEFARHRIGPVVRRDEIDYFREVRFLEAVRVNVLLAGVADDNSRFRLVNEIRRIDGEVVARVSSLGGWFDLAARRLASPPPLLADAMRDLERTPDFEVLPSSMR